MLEIRTHEQVEQRVQAAVEKCQAKGYAIPDGDHHMIQCVTELCRQFIHKCNQKYDVKGSPTEEECDDNSCYDFQGAVYRLFLSRYTMTE